MRKSTAVAGLFRQTERTGIACPFRLSKNLYNEKGRPPYPYKSAKSRDLCVAFCTSQGRGAPLVRWPDGHTFFGPVSGRPYFLCFSAYNRPGAGAQYGSGGSPPARERSMGAEALRQPLAKTRKSGLSHFFDTLKAGAICSGLVAACYAMEFPKA